MLSPRPADVQGKETGHRVCLSVEKGVLLEGLRTSSGPSG